MITTDSRIEYRVTVIHVKVEVPGTGLDEDDQQIEQKFWSALLAYDLGIVYKPTTSVEVQIVGYSRFHHTDNTWKRQYKITITEPVK